MLGETETQSISLQPGRSPVSPSRCSSFLHSCSQGKKCPNPIASCQNILPPTQVHPISRTLCLASRSISSAPECDGKIQSKNLPWELFPSSGKPFSQAEQFTSPSKPPVQHIPMKFMLLPAPSTPSTFPSLSFMPLLPVHTCPCPLHVVWFLAVGIPGRIQYCPRTSACQGSISQCLSWSKEGSTFLASLKVCGLPAPIPVSRTQGLAAPLCCKVPSLETREK